jgi:hypothetical protein
MNASVDLQAGSGEPAALEPRHWALVTAFLLVVAVVTRMATFGHPDHHIDEAFYFAAAVEMLHGAVPYVDVWDRKPPGHFLLYAGIAAVSGWYVAYQIAATLFVATTALVLFALGLRLGTKWSALIGAVLYVVVVCQFHGQGGQSPVFYNLFMAASAALVVASLPRFDSRKGQAMVALAMLLAGVAITIKTTTVFEAAFFGLFAAGIQIGRSGLSGTSAVRIATWIALGLLPSAAFALWYALNGFWDEYWTAMVLSNLRKPVEDNGASQRLLILALMVLPLAAASVVGLLHMAKELRVFCAGWLVASLVGFFSVPAYYLHYALPMLVPLCAIGATSLAMPRTGTALLGVAGMMPLLFVSFFDFAETRDARAAMDRLVVAVEESKGDGPLLVYDGPPLLYTLTGSRFPTPLAFPNHLHQESERNVSHIDTLEEVRRLLAERPGAIVDRTTLVSNDETSALVRAYARENCRLVASESMIEGWNIEVEVYGHCHDSGSE